MKNLFTILVFFVLFSSCKTNLRVTGNPDKSTSTSGTIGSSKLTDGVADNSIYKGSGADSSKRRKDGLPH